MLIRGGEGRGGILRIRGRGPCRLLREGIREERGRGEDIGMRGEIMIDGLMRGLTKVDLDQTLETENTEETDTDTDSTRLNIKSSFYSFHLLFFCLFEIGYFVLDR